MCILESQSEARYNNSIVVCRNETFWKKFASMRFRIDLLLNFALRWPTFFAITLIILARMLITQPRLTPGLLYMVKIAQVVEGPGQTTRFFTRFFTQQKIEEKIEPFGHLVE